MGGLEALIRGEGEVRGMSVGFDDEVEDKKKLEEEMNKKLLFVWMEEMGERWGGTD